MKSKIRTPLENFRRARTLSQGDLARIVGIGQQSLSKAERGRLVLSRDVRQRIAAVLGVTEADAFPDLAPPSPFEAGQS